MPDYVGNWIECHNRNCGFPIRVPYAEKRQQGKDSPTAYFFFACPVCLQVNPYYAKDMREVRFRFPDPYKTGKVVFYSAQMGCAHSNCRTERVIFTVAAAKVSVATLLPVWQGWEAKFRCAQKHRFQIPNPGQWWIQEENGWPELAADDPAQSKD